MVNRTGGPETPSKKPASRAEARRERLSASLRANLRRRKNQTRSRAEPTGPGGSETPESGAGQMDHADQAEPADGDGA